MQEKERGRGLSARQSRRCTHVVPVLVEEPHVVEHKRRQLRGALGKPQGAIGHQLGGVVDVWTEEHSYQGAQGKSCARAKGQSYAVAQEQSYAGAQGHIDRELIVACQGGDSRLAD